MKKYNMITPEGTKDILFEECISRRKIEKRLNNIFTKRAYNEVISPGIEYFDVFNIEGAAIPQFEMYKTTDNKGRLVVVRPDLTLPVVRLAATRLKNYQTPIRLYYNQPVYRNRPDLSGRSDESFQAGIELLGAGGISADLEVLCTAVEALKSFELPFRIEIGHAAIFKYLIEKLNVNDDTRELIRTTIESKNYAAMNDIIKTIEPSVYSEAIKKLPRLFGGEEVFEAAGKFSDEAVYVDCLSHLKELYTALCKMGLKENIIVDLGLVQRNDYYTGVVFSAYVEGHGAAVLTGGRYDNLLEKFNAPMPAVGFAVEIDAVTNIVSENEEVPNSDYIIHAKKGKEIEAQMEISNLTRMGFVCENSMFDSEEKLREYAKEKGIRNIIIIGDEVVKESV